MLALMPTDSAVFLTFSIGYLVISSVVIVNLLLQLGEQTGEHGSYIFYKSFQYMRKGKWRTVQLGRFFFVRVSKGGPICVGELQLAWTGRHSSHPLASVKLYYLPEQIPDGRQPHHGQVSAFPYNYSQLYLRRMFRNGFGLACPFAAVI